MRLKLLIRECYRASEHVIRFLGSLSRQWNMKSRISSDLLCLSFSVILILFSKMFCCTSGIVSA